MAAQTSGEEPKCDLKRRMLYKYSTVVPRVALSRYPLSRLYSHCLDYCLHCELSCYSVLSVGCYATQTVRLPLKWRHCLKRNVRVTSSLIQQNSSVNLFYAAICWRIAEKLLKNCWRIADCWRIAEELLISNSSAIRQQIVSKSLISISLSRSSEVTWKVSYTNDSWILLIDLDISVFPVQVSNSESGQRKIVWMWNYLGCWQASIWYIIYAELFLYIN